jgi:hypothetical protein
MLQSMSQTNPWSEADEFDLDPRYEVINGLPDADGRVIIVAAALMKKHPEWLQLVGFVAGDGRMNLVAFSVVRTPTEWDHPGPDGRDSILRRLGDQVAMDSTCSGYLTTAIVRSAATADLEMRVRRHMNAVEWDGRKVADTWFGGSVDVGPSRKPTGPVSAKMARIAQIAQRYVQLCHETPTPRPQLMQEFNLANNTIQGYLHVARKEGLLTKPERRGMAGGKLTDLALTILDDAAAES